MFFTISTEADSNFQNHTVAFSWVISLDNGWESSSDSDCTIFYKGYVDSDLPLSKHITSYNWDAPSYLDGNFTLIKISKQSVVLRHSRLRPYPLWASDTVLTNLYPIGNQMWSDDVVNIVDRTLTTSKTTTVFTDNADSISATTTKICRLLQSKVSNLGLSNNIPIKVFKSGGLDTALVYAMIKSGHLEFDHVVEQHWDHTEFVQVNSKYLDKFWAYNQLHHWKDHTLLATGSHGDEFFLRGPQAIAMLTAWHDIDFVSALESQPDAYHYRYFSKEKNLNIFKTHYENRQHLREMWPTLHHLKIHLLDMLANDHQHWHLENTITWTPFMDIRIPALVLSLPVDQLMPQFLNGDLTRACIAYFYPDALADITEFKNQ